MRQVTQEVRRGTLRLADVPRPAVLPGHILVENRHSLISAGTEKSLRDLAKKSLYQKAKERPDHLRRVLEKVRNEGFWSTLHQVRQKLDEPMAMGYCSAGVVLACGAGVEEFKPGDRVASNGPHAEVVCVPKHLCARVPDEMELEMASFTVLGAIAMQGIRLSQAALGETALVIGLGLIGQITVALLRAAGVRVLGTDLDGPKCDLARRLGAEFAAPGLAAKDVERLTGGLGADVALITASTKSDGPVELAAESIRRRGRIVAVGAVGMNLPRKPLYMKEAEFVVSCSYGPGRYDPKYEDLGQDYPAGYVRWTEQRNMQAVLDLLASRKVDFSPLVSHRLPFTEMERAYELVESGKEPVMGILIGYPEGEKVSEIEKVPCPDVIRLRTEPSTTGIGIGCLGAGNFARAVLLPQLSERTGVRLEAICSSGGLSAHHAGEKFGFSRATSNETSLVTDPRIDAVFVLTQHDAHARLVCDAIRAGKHVFVEKPLCLTIEELREIEEEIVARGDAAGIVMVGFNRRFSPAARAVRKAFERCTQPLTVSIRFNAGEIPPDHWTQNEQIGGGRIIGEACHAIDLASYLTGSPPVRVFAESIGGPRRPQVTDDQCFITLRHANGSVSQIAYLAGGDKAFPKERVEVVGGGQVAVLEDFRSVETWAGGKHSTPLRGNQDKGHAGEITAFLDAISNGGEAPIPWEQIRATTVASILAVRSLREGWPFDFGISEIVKHAEANVA